MEALELIEKDNIQYVDARNLYDFLELSPSHFAKWCGKNITGNVYVDDDEYEQKVIEVKMPNGGIKYSTGYNIRLSLAKKICMASSAPKGNQAREYFLKCESLLKEVLEKSTLEIPQTFSQALYLAAKQQEELEEKDREIKRLAQERDEKVWQLAEQAESVEAYKQLMSSKGFISLSEAAKVLGASPRNLLVFLKERGILSKQNVPIQRFIDEGAFVVLTKTIKGKFISITRITPIGLERIRKYINNYNLKENVTEFKLLNIKNQ